MNSGYFDFKLTGDQKVKIALCEAQNWRCCYCNFPVAFIPGETEEQSAATFEHVIPLARGGKDKLNNLVIACMLCNNTRSRGNHERFARVIKRLLMNPLIKSSWHKFNKQQLSLLKEEIIFGCVLEKSSNGQPAKVRMLVKFKESRKKMFNEVIENKY